MGTLRTQREGGLYGDHHLGLGYDCEPGHEVHLQIPHKERVKRIKGDFSHFPSSEFLLMPH